MTTKEDTKRAREQAQAQYESIQEMVKALEEGKEYEGQDPHEAIQDDPLEVSVRTDWHTPGEGDKPTEYLILLCTGGPAARITGDLDEHGQPETANLQYQDWFTEWFTLHEDIDEEILLTYARQFYFGS